MIIFFSVLLIVGTVCAAQFLPRVRQPRRRPCQCWMCKRLANPRHPAIAAGLKHHFTEWENELAAKGERP